MILGTRQYQFKTKILDNPTCGYCNASEETIEHLFCECAPIICFWNDLRSYVQQKLGMGLNLNPINIILDQFKTDPNYTFYNILYLITKKYIFQCSKACKNPNLLGLLKRVEFVYRDQKLAAILNSTAVQFEREWHKVKLLIQIPCVPNDTETIDRQKTNNFQPCYTINP